jgi:hypothetical protein
MAIISEFVVLEGSPLIGQKLQAIVETYGVKILHFHNPTLALDSKTAYDPTRELKKNFCLKVEGEIDDVARLRMDSVNFS